ncbi:MAG: amidohydrolase family protein [Hungatella sp.]|nr:amidohydrolase family protein [Hungatella sp.]
MNTILIKNGLVYDGLGTPGVHRDIFLENGMIKNIGQQMDIHGADRIIDAGGRVVCPGFVDIHRHCDIKPLYDKDFGGCELAQGITTIVVGNCGMSPTPCPEGKTEAGEMYGFYEPVLGPMPLDGGSMPKSYEEYLKALDQAKLPMNIAAMIGTGAVRISVKGFSDKPYSREELIRARRLIEEAMESGAPGVSLGIMYLPECYASADEFAYILEPVGRYHRVITAHIRGEGNKMVESVAEVIEIAKKAGCALEISHFKSCGIKNWRKDIHTAIGLIEKARQEGIDVTCDFYPYDGGSTALTTMLPPDFVKGDMGRALKLLGTEEGVREFRRKSRMDWKAWDNFCVLLGWDRILISGVVEDEFLPMVGMTVEKAAKSFGYEDAEALAARLMHKENGRTAIINMSMCQEDIDTVARLPYSNVISDAIYGKTDRPHPRMFGAFPKIIREYVRERGVYSLEEAIRRMTSQPAARMGIEKRGYLAEGTYGDILIFDPEKFCDHATYADPARTATGLDYCMVNGEIVIDHDTRLDGVFPGACIRVNHSGRRENQ